MIQSDSLTDLLRSHTAALKHLRRATDELLTALERPSTAALPSPKAKPAPPPSLPMSLRTLAPLAPPRPGSLRDDIYRVLEGHPRLTRADIIEAVTTTRPHRDRAHLVSKIHDTLNHVRDPRIQRVGRGVYRLVSSAR